MRQLLNTLFVTIEDAYATLDGENIVIYEHDEVKGRFPLHILESVYLFTYKGASPSLMGKCAEKGIDLVFCSPYGRFMARTIGKSRGNVLLRHEQYRLSDDREKSCKVARNLIFGKVSNSRHVLARTRRDHSEKIDTERFKTAEEQLRGMLEQILKEESLEELRGIEGAAAVVYFKCFDEMILRNKEHFFLKERNRRPPLDNVNSMLSFVYMMLGNDCASALEMVGLDSYVGFLHRERPGRTSLALDLLEEMRSCVADRFVLKLINDQMVNEKDFERQEGGAVIIRLEGRKKLQKAWHERKQVKIEHPFLHEKIEWGLVPYVQALLMARYIRGDLEEYPPFLWK